ncbi:MAG TPA: flagellin [Thermoguttaceae bacterium]|nr:flagellin [Thermoguttaceae bacterium]
MANIVGIPTTRVSDLFMRQRLTNQIQMDQLDAFRVQMQLSTGRRIQVPSEDSNAAMRIIDLQRLLERKGQVRSNLSTNQSYLLATDSALSSVSGSLAEIRAVAMGVVGEIATDAQRTAASQQVQQMIRQLQDIANQKFRGRYLFAGTSTTVMPFGETDKGGYVQYFGNEGKVSSYSDIDLLFETNLHGGEVFGAISEKVLGAKDLDPILTYNTRLADLRSGAGITRGSIEISVAGNRSTIDITSAETIGDVAAMIRANPPAGKTLDVEIAPTGLVVTLHGDPGDTLAIREVGGGTTADELGILTRIGVGTTVVGEDLDPILRLTTRIGDVLGTRSYAPVRSYGSDNDLIFEAPTVGAAYDGIEILFEDDGSVALPGDETASYDPATNTLTVKIKSHQTEARHVVSAVETAFLAGNVPITARLDPLDSPNGGRGVIAATPVGQIEGQTAGGSGTAFDADAGIQIVNGGETHVITFTGAETIEDLLNVLNMSDAGLTARINGSATGIDIRSRISGVDFMIGENGGQTATQLGLRTFTETTRLEDLNFGRGVATRDGTDFTITIAGTPAGPPPVPIEIDVSGLETVGEVIDLINAQAPGELVARLATYGNGIELVDQSTGTDTLTVSRVQLGRAAIDLGLVPEGQESYSAAAPLLVTSTTTKSNLIFTADNPGAEVAGVRVVFEDTGTGNVTYDPTAKTLTFGITTAPPAAATTAADIIAWLEASPAGAEFSAELDPADTDSDGSGNVEDTDPFAPPLLGDEGGTEASATVVFSGTDNDLVFRAKSALPAQVGTEIQFNGVAAFGPPTFAYAGPGNPLIITYDSDGTTAQEIVDGLAADAGPAGANFSAALDPTDGSPNLGTGTVDVQTSTPMAGGSRFLKGADVNRQETEGIFTALLRLKTALMNNDLGEIERSIALLDDRTDKMNFARAELGVRQQGLDITQVRLDNEEIDLKESLSRDFDVDMIQAISDFTARQISFEASLRTAAQLLSITLLNYL